MIYVIFFYLFNIQLKHVEGVNLNQNTHLPDSNEIANEYKKTVIHLHVCKYKRVCIVYALCIVNIVFL